jgi:prepilin-type N-terminal cleavage/methylation domain-containing protein
MNTPMKKDSSRRRPQGFTLIELLIGSAIMLVVIVAALAIYSRSNQIAVDQQQYAEIQNDVRSAMFLTMRDIRMAGVGLPEGFRMFAFEGVDNEDQGSEVQPDRLIVMGNMNWPLNARIESYLGAASATSLTVDDYSFEQYPYSDDFYVNKTALILPNDAGACRTGEVRTISHISHSTTGTSETFNFLAGTLDNVFWGAHPGGPLESLKGTCSPASSYDGGTVMLVDVKVYWLDVRGSQPGLTAGLDGYLGLPGVFYVTTNGIHNPIAQNIENFQVQYNGDIDDNGILDGFQDWNAGWTLDEVSRIRQVRVQLLGRTVNRFVSVSGKPDAAIHHYRRPDMADSPGAKTDDLHRRFLLESTSNIRNLSLGLYNQGER